MRIPSWLDPELYPFAHNSFEVAAGRMHYVDEGSGLPLVMVHGNPTWSFIYRHLISHFSDRYRCVAPDHIGFGLSDKPVEWSYRPKDHAENLEALIDQLELDEITLVVQDWGGPIGLAYALKHPERVKRIVLLNTWCWPVDRELYYRAYSSLMGGWFGRLLIRRYNFFARTIMPRLFADRSKLSRFIHRQYLEALSTAAERKGCWQLAREVSGSTEWLEYLWARSERLVTKEVLIVWGMRDYAFRRRELNRWIERFPRAPVKRLPVGHYLQEEAPNRLIDAMEQMLSSSARLPAT
jgi:haloalkane dehalogenase